MTKIDLKWNHKTEEKLFQIFRKLSYSHLTKTKIDKKKTYESILKTFMDFSINLEKKWHKADKIDVKKHLSLATKQVNGVMEWQKKIRMFVKTSEKEDLQRKLLNNAKFRARNMQGNYYKDFLKEIVAEDSDYFEWNTMGDERVRPEHENRDGEIFNFDTADLLPGEDPGCRCWATAYFPENINGINDIDS